MTDASYRCHVGLILTRCSIHATVRFREDLSQDDFFYICKNTRSLTVSLSLYLLVSLLYFLPSRDASSRESAKSCAAEKKRSRNLHVWKRNALSRWKARNFLRSEIGNGISSSSVATSSTGWKSSLSLSPSFSPSSWDEARFVVLKAQMGRTYVEGRCARKHANSGALLS